MLAGDIMEMGGSKGMQVELGLRGYYVNHLSSSISSNMLIMTEMHI